MLRATLLLCALLLAATGCSVPSPEPTTTPAATATSLTPTPTSEPGFERFQGEGFDIRLPEIFASGAPDFNIELDVDNYIELPGGIQPLKFSIGRTQEAGLADLTLNDLAVVFIEALGQTPGSTFIERLDFVPPDAEMVRLVTSLDPSMTGLDENVMLVQYIILDEDTRWLITFGTAESSLESWLELFDTSAQTFHITDEAGSEEAPTLDPDADRDSCLDGNWIMPTADLNLLVASLVPIPNIRVLGGSLYMSFVDGVYDYSGEFTLQIDLDEISKGQYMQADAIFRSGGPYTTERVSTSRETQNFLVLDLSASEAQVLVWRAYKNGETITMPGTGPNFVILPPGNAPYRCSATLLEIDTQGALGAVTMYFQL